MRKLRPKDSREPAPRSPVRSGCLQRFSHFELRDRVSREKGEAGDREAVGKSAVSRGGAERAAPATAALTRLGPSPAAGPSSCCRR